MAARIIRRYLPSIERRLLKYYYSATPEQLADGLRWYESQRAACVVLSAQYHISLEATCGVVAAISPGCAWTNNLVYAESIIKDYTRGLRGRDIGLVGTYGWSNIFKCQSILAGNNPAELLKGKKTRAFFDNLLWPSSEYVTIDRHAKMAALDVVGDAHAVVKDSEYDWLVSHYRRAALKLGIAAFQLQAVVWVFWKQYKDTERVPF